MILARRHHGSAEDLVEIDVGIAGTHSGLHRQVGNLRREAQVFPFDEPDDAATHAEAGSVLHGVADPVADLGRPVAEPCLEFRAAAERTQRDHQPSDSLEIIFLVALGEHDAAGALLAGPREDADRDILAERPKLGLVEKGLEIGENLVPRLVRRRLHADRA